MEEMIELKDGIRIINKDNGCYVVVDDLAKIASYKTVDYLADQLCGSHDLKTNVSGADVYIVPINKVESILSNKNLTGKLKKLEPYHKLIKDIMNKEINKTEPKILKKEDTKDNINWILTNINNMLVNINNSLIELINISKNNINNVSEPVSNIDNIIDNFNKDKEKYLSSVEDGINYDIETGQYHANKREQVTATTNNKTGLVFHASSNVWKYKSLTIDDPNLRTNINKNIEYIVKNADDNPLASTITNIYSTLYSRLANNATYPFDAKKSIYNMRRETGNYKLKFMDAVMADEKATIQFLLLLDQLYEEVFD